MNDTDPEVVTVASLVSLARPEAPDPVARRARLNRVLGAVLGGERAPPRIGRYVIHDRVGAGGMGVVYRARDPDSDRPVVLKLLGPESTGERARFDREARLLQSIAHPRVVRYLDHGETADGRPYLVMEWLEGEELARVLRRGPLDVSVALRILRGPRRPRGPLRSRACERRSTRWPAP